MKLNQHLNTVTDTDHPCLKRFRFLSVRMAASASQPEVASGTIELLPSHHSRQKGHI